MFAQVDCHELQRARTLLAEGNVIAASNIVRQAEGKLELADQEAKKAQEQATELVIAEVKAKAEHKARIEEFNKTNSKLIDSIKTTGITSEAQLVQTEEMLQTAAGLYKIELDADGLPTTETLRIMGQNINSGFKTLSEGKDPMEEAVLRFKNPNADNLARAYKYDTDPKEALKKESAANPSTQLPPPPSSASINP